MARRRLTKSEKETIEKIQTIQLRTLTELRSRAQVLYSSTEQIIKKINEVGIDNHYSIHSDVLRYASEVWAASLRLGELKTLRNDLEYTYSIKKSKK